MFDHRSDRCERSSSRIYPKIFAKNLPILWKNPDLCCGFGCGAGGASATATGPVSTDGPNPGTGAVATVAALSGVAIPVGVPVGTVCFGAM
jgi:hypothetical protein